MRWSLKWKIQFWHGSILTVLAIILGVLFYQHEREIMLRQTDWMLDQCIHPINTFATFEKRHRSNPQGKHPPRGEVRSKSSFGEWESVGFQPDPEYRGGRGHLSVVEAFESALEPQGYYFIVWDRSGKQIIKKSNNAPEIPHPGIRPPGAWRRVVPGERRELYQGLRYGDIIVGRYTAQFDATLANLRMKLFLGGTAFVVVGIAVGSLLVSGSLRPLQIIRQRSRKVAQGHLSERIELKRGSGSLEIEELSQDLNATFSSLEKLFARQTAFTADASHELRTPLTALIAQVKRGQSGNRSEEDYQYIFEICDRSLARLKRIVDDLLELSRYDSGQVKLDREELPLDLLVATIIDDYRPMIETQGSKIECEVLACTAYCDPFRIEQVVSNLITNALKHNPEPVTISLRVKCLSEWAIIEVKDNGVGIKPEHCDQLFDRFFQQNKSGNQPSEMGPNSGLGLAISKAIVEAHGGTIQVQSTLGVSTTFEIKLPTASRIETD